MAQARDPDKEIAKILGETGGTPMVMGGAYDAGDRFDRTLALWQPANQSIDRDILPSKERMDARARDIVRNDAYVQSAVRIHRDSIVGAQYMLNAKPNFRFLGLDDAWAREFAEEVEPLWDVWAESFNNWPDAARRNTFTSLIRLAVGVYMTYGEWLATVEWRSLEEDRPMFTAIQPIELNRLSDPRDQSYDPTQVRGGIRMTRSGRPLGYYIRRAEIGTYGNLVDVYKWAYIRAHSARYGPLSKRPQVIHITEQKYPNQTRGVSDLVAALKEMRMVRRFRDITLQNAAINASFAATIESELPDNAIYESLGSGNISQSVLDFADNYLQGVAKFSTSAKNLQIDGVKIPHLYPGTKLSLQPAGTPGGIGTEFEASFLRYMAANLGVSYEELSKDYQKASYSSVRAALNQTGRGMRARKSAVSDKLATLIYRLWFEEAVNAGMIETMKAQRVPNIYEKLAMEAFCRAQWIGTGPGQVDELKETQAAVLRLKQGISTYEEETARFGRDYRQVFEQRAREKARMEELDIVPVEMQDVAELSTTERDGDGDGNEENDDG